MNVVQLIQRGGVLLILLWGAQACGPGSGRTGRSRPPEAPPISTASADDVRQAFEDLSAQHGALSRSGPPSAPACEELAASFKRLHDTNRGRKEAVGIERAWFNAAVVLEECGQIDRATETYEAVARAYPKFDLPHNNLGVVLWNRGEPRRAIAHFEKAIAANPKTTMPRTNLAALLRKQYVRDADDGDFRAAESQIQTALAVDAGDVAAYENLARLYYDRGRLADRSYLLLAGLVVTQALRASQEQAPRRADLHNLQGLLEIEAGDQVAALRAFEEAVRIDPRHHDAHLNLAMVAIRFRDYARAERSLAVVASDSRRGADADVHLGLGVAQRGLNRYEDAKRSFETAAKLAKHDARPIYNLGILYQEHIATHTAGKALRENEEAKRYFETFIARAGGQGGLEVAVADARRRVSTIDEYFRSVTQMEELERTAAAAELQQQREDETRRQHLLELERRARAAAEHRS